MIEATTGFDAGQTRLRPVPERTSVVPLAKHALTDSLR